MTSEGETGAEIASELYKSGHKNVYINSSIGRESLGRKTVFAEIFPKKMDFPHYLFS